MTTKNTMKKSFQVITLLLAIVWIAFLLNEFALPDGWFLEWWGVPFVISGFVIWVMSLMALAKYHSKMNEAEGDKRP